MLIYPGSVPYPSFKFLDWTTWTTADRQLRALRSKILQGERYHLYCVHTLFFPQMIAMLKLRCFAITGSRIAVRANSYWIDAKPQAHWRQSGKAKNVELADLLLDLRVRAAGLPTSRRAALVQAKWTDQCDNLGAAACFPGQDDSTNLERDLLEFHVGDVELWASGKQKTAIADHLGNNCFNVAFDRRGQPLIAHSSYLLFPKVIDSVGEPYQCLEPFSRVMPDGDRENFEDLLCRLALPYWASAAARTALVPEVSSRPEWERLVNAIAAWARVKGQAGQTVNRVGQHFPHHSGAFFIANLPDPLAERYDDNENFWNGNYGFPRDGEDFNGGFWYVQLTIDYLDPMGDGA